MEISLVKKKAPPRENIEALDAVSENEGSSANGLTTPAKWYSSTPTVCDELRLKHTGEAPVEEAHDKIASKTPTTPEKKTGMEDTSIDPAAPPVSRNPLASPMFKQINAFEVVSPTVATTQLVDSPLITPRIQLKKLEPTDPKDRGRTEKGVATSPSSQDTLHYITTKPTCSLNLVCYRSGARGCELHQIQTVKGSRFKDDAEFQKVLVENPELISRDEQFFNALRDVYLGKMCNFWRRSFFLKTLRGIRLLSVSVSA